MMEIEAIRRAQDRGQTLTFESAISTMIYAIGSIEKMGDLDEEQLSRFRQAVVRASNAERKKSRD